MGFMCSSADACEFADVNRADGYMPICLQQINCAKLFSIIMFCEISYGSAF